VPCRDTVAACAVTMARQWCSKVAQLGASEAKGSAFGSPLPGTCTRKSPLSKATTWWWHGSVGNAAAAGRRQGQRLGLPASLG
jgi:hypothetical protein